MSDYPPPREILPIFNESDFTHKDDNISHAEGDGKYLRITGGDISGDLEISGKLEISDGLVSSPSLTFFNESNTGIYRSGTHKLNFSVLGSEVAHFTTDETLIKTAQLDIQNGSVSLPSLSFEDDQDLGLYRVSANVLGVSAGNKKVMEIANSTIDFFTEEFEIFDNSSNTMMLVNNNGQILANDIYSLGASNPAFSFDTDTNTGLFRVSDNILGFSTNGFSRVEISFDTSNFSNDIEISSSEELRCNTINTTNPALPLNITASDYSLNGNLSNLGQPHILLRKTIDQTIATATPTEIDYDTIISNSIITKLLPSNSEFQLGSIGIFLATAEIWLENSNIGYREAYFQHSEMVNIRYGYTRIESVNENNIKFTITAIISVNNPASSLKLIVEQGSGINMLFRTTSQFRNGEMSIIKLF